MPWLSYSDDEVRSFHPVFFECADAALAAEALEGEYEWRHHERTLGNRLIPDFVLCRRDTGRWRLALEIKRTPASVFSNRNQNQAHGYALANSDLFQAGVPVYYAISNLEQTLVFALRPGLSPHESRLQDGYLGIGALLSMSEADFRTALTTMLLQLIRRVLIDQEPVFDDIWPQIVANFVRAASIVAGVQPISEPTTANWALVRDYFCHPIDVDTARILVLRCLFAEFIHGVLERFGHPDVGSLLPFARSDSGNVGQMVANALARLRAIDFQALFEAESLEIYRNLPDRRVRDQMAEYVGSIVTRPSAVRELARSRLDRNDFLSGIVSTSYQGENLDDRGKVLTDPELAAVLSAVGILSADVTVMDPCCGDGALLDAGYDRLRSLGLNHGDAIRKIQGVEADPIFARLAFLRVMLKEPAAIRPTPVLAIKQADMFAQALELAKADVVLMNPPFRRYEAQDPNPIPNELRDYFIAQILALSGGECIANAGQQNLFTCYFEFLIRAVHDDCRMAIILDNKWYHNQYGSLLRDLILRTCEINAIIEYPFANLFSDWNIATSIIVCTKRNTVPANHNVKFLRCSLDLSQVNPAEVASLVQEVGALTAGWTRREEAQSNLDPREGWKRYFSADLTLNYSDGLPLLPSLFRYGRRGSLAKEEGGMSAIAFPFSGKSFGHLREANPDAERRYQNKRIRVLTNSENRELQRLAANLREEFRGYAVNNSDRLSSYEMTEGDVLNQPTFEPPPLRGVQEFWSERKTAWLEAHNEAVAAIEADPAANAFIAAFRRITGLDETVMPDEWLFVGLKEPYAGELIIPRKTRASHRVYVNPFACNHQGRQVRLSSNFVSYVDCLSTDTASNLDRLDSVRMIAAFLISSFGQLQFEMLGYNREGCLSVELHHLEQIHVLDPRTIPTENRRPILDAFTSLPYPIPTDRLSSELPERNALDNMFASVLCASRNGWRPDNLVAEVHQLLDEYILARMP